METGIIEIIESIEEKSAGLSFPEYINNLKQAGVVSYDVEVCNRNKVFKTKSGQEVPILGQLIEIDCDEKFNRDKAIEAIKRTQAGTTSYSTFLRELADAGVHTYFVDLKNMFIKYKGTKEGEEYTEKIEEINQSD